MARRSFFIFLIIIDLLAFYTSLEAAVLSRTAVDVLFPGVIDFEFSFAYFAGLWWIPLILLGTISYKGLYGGRQPAMEEAKNIMGAVTFSLLIVFALVSIGRMTDMVSRLTLFFLWFYSMLIFPLLRIAGKRVLFALGVGTDKILVAGCGADSASAAEAILAERNYGYEIYGFYGKLECGSKTLRAAGHEYPVYTGGIDSLLEAVNTVVFVESEFTQDEITELTTKVRRRIKGIVTVPDAGRGIMMNSEFHYLFRHRTFLLKAKNNLASRFNKYAKRAFDIAFTLAVLPFVGLIMLVAGILIKLDSRGNIFYSHERVGENGKRIRVLKMRSMYTDSAERLEHILKNDPVRAEEWRRSRKFKNDPRITKVGRILRKTSIDEMPQFINVLKGDMSVVGPRPIVESEIEEHYGKDGEYYRMVKPGITGLWQVSGRSDTAYDDRVRLDSWYVINWSIWLDILIIMKTLGVVIKKEGAY
ncbi:undecaprenyl-phosphate galactose phosphotransferase WbaP [Limisalsivibrio acetivorans]|uniref:undecaprenyl-phosphate galactose phosphotransferase WbaP n=1 Tax=Limisalsivibrio acetivorans TaxID=1304888 RepID=UPI0003B6203C|nr:undecaprenyl-phosphate galactose phosphotransferase WbaP [Limisalsivibrio acetivorans]